MFLAAKVEEAPKRVRDVINVYYHLTQKREGVVKPEPLDTNKQVCTYCHNMFCGSCADHFHFQLYWDLKNDLIKNERMVLRELGFMVYVELPHKYIPTYINFLRLGNEVTQQAWNFTNDRYGLHLISQSCLTFTPPLSPPLRSS